MSETVAAIRRFNRFYTRRIGALDEAHLGEPFSLAEMRVLYEIAQAPDGVAPKTVAGRTGLDGGYLSRILKRFEREGLTSRAPSAEDGRSVALALADDGRRAYQALRLAAEGAVERMIAALSAPERERLTAAMGEVERLLQAEPADAVILRPHRVGDIGWVIERHGTLYAREYGWDERFEALVARIAADFVEDFDPARERCWIAERGGQRLGSVFLVKGEGDEAKLRLLLVEPSARGLGLGRRLVRECVDFARACGYGGVSLWTRSLLTAARAIYAAQGFQLVESQPHPAMGAHVAEETWRLRF